jgi:hypothetical protein
LDEGLKHLGLFLKQKYYMKVDQNWMVAKVEKIISSWCFKWLSKGGRLLLLKSVLEAIPMYWMSLTWIPKGVLEEIRSLSYRFLWFGSREKKGFSSAKLEKLTMPKALGGWGLRTFSYFIRL